MMPNRHSIFSFALVWTRLMSHKLVYLRFAFVLIRMKNKVGI